ncbi:glycosyltransferase family 2 protein [Photobacterium leiognathi]|uniref:glycosyltransferase family 2 protein n=1 Tax=Photobacterium leiognathi TaxID=553611 RepID=UPI002982AB9F|nr:glycosyltransferase family 2 protein [Photobacterium leiognathi]
MNKLTIAISTLNHNRDKLIEHLRSFPFLDDIEYIIISQREDDNVVIDLNSNIKLIKSTSSGLSKSRNIAISLVRTEWIWFQDDDISLIFENIPFLIERLDDSINACFIKIRSNEDEKKLYKNYYFHRRHQIVNCFKISSIEIIVKVDFLKRNKVSFNEHLGLGTDLPCCEESLFLYNVFNNTDECRYISLPVACHTTVIESRGIDFNRRMVARGYSLRFFPKFLSFLLFIKWGIGLTKPRGVIFRYKLLLKGMMIR